MEGNMAVTYKKLLHLMIDQNMTNAQLAEKAGISLNIITRLKRDEYVSLETIEKICITLQAFINEVCQVYATDTDMPKKMVEYLIGTNDYYKVVSRDGKRLTIIHTFNIHGTLNNPSKIKVSAITVPIAELPTELVTLKFKTGSNNTVEMYLNNGWQLSFRIHNASTKVEPSLKFDVQFIGIPVSILNIECRWK